MSKENTNSLICGNTLDELRKIKDNSIGVGVTSPPYNKQGKKNKGWLVGSVVYNDYVDCVNEADYQKNQIEVLNELYRITKEGGSFFYNHKVRWDKGKMLHPM